MTQPTPYGETATLFELFDITKPVPPQTPIIIRVIEREAIIEVVDGEPEDFSRLRIHAPSETHTYILDPEDIEFQDGMLYLVVGDQAE